jgi:hypothetical protein
MLGDKIGSDTGKITSQRVLANTGGGVKTETSFRASGKLLGVNQTSTATYWSIVRPDGTLYGEGQGVVIGASGEMATWIGQGVGTIKKGGGVSYRGAVYYTSSSPKWLRLNGVAAVFEHEATAKGATKSALWEWK